MFQDWEKDAKDNNEMTLFVCGMMLGVLIGFLLTSVAVYYLKLI